MNYQIPMGLDFDKVNAIAKSLQVKTEEPKREINLWQQHGHFITSRRQIISEKQEIISYCDKELRELNKNIKEAEKRIAQCEDLLEKNSYAHGVRDALDDHRHTVKKLTDKSTPWINRRKTAQGISDAAAKQIATLPLAEIEAARKEYEAEQRAIESVL